VDCLVCHDQTGTYKKWPSGAGHPVKAPKKWKGKKLFLPPDWNKVAQSVSRPSRKNCGTCHFYGGGGDGVKHGDLDSSLFKPNKELDVHMGIDGQNFDCVRCHSTTQHNIAGRVYSTPASENRKSLVEDDLASKITCESCHTNKPHKLNKKANDHTDKVACQSCHIPSFARVNPTKVRWDWSTAGKLKNGKPYGVKNKFGHYSYMSKKGDMFWEKNVKPEYLWYNGSIKHITVKDTIDPAGVVKISHPVGSADDKNSRIFPFKLHTGKQPYDKINKNLVIMNIFPDSKADKNAFWKGFKFDKAIKEGMEYVNLPYSGEFDFVETSYAFPTTHMVAPKENVVQCIECHTRKDGRMAKISGVFIPGRDHSDIINNIGLLAIFGTLGIIILHAVGRIVTGKNGKKEA